MENFWESVNLMFFVYGLAALISIVVAWSIKLIFGVIGMKEKRAAANGPAPDNEGTS
ncbi:MAG: hypothetical protein HN884_03385 [Rhodospirillaceae bacterium]|jgi:hypothetical protein|nr:hypothetical protein [Rhodospirillaceae bacterium]MBT4587933.1 hypothetical protein [Rhodospirillaceae bacterium]MBT7265892.1 hypothetical protein [Rhodospirillaceae bacterium]